MTHQFSYTASLRGRGLWPRLGAGILALALAGCDTDALVDLDDPDIVTVPVVTDTANVSSLRNGVTFEFARAVAGPAANNETPGIVGLSGLFADELWYVSTFGSMQDIDRRRIIDVTNGDLNSVYHRIHRARNLSDRAIEQYVAAGRENTADAAMVVNFGGFSYIYLAENFCSGVPISRTSLAGDVTFGGAQTTEALLDSAAARFDRALTLANAAFAAAPAGTAGNAARTAAQAQQNVARVGLGRTRLARGDFAGAAAAVADVPAGFAFDVPFSESTSGQNNGVWQNVNSEKRSSAASREGVNGIRFFNRGATNNVIDPRVSVDSTGSGIGTTFPHYRQNKYPTHGADIPLATGVEAQLIRAEAALNKGASAAYLTTLNQLRAGVTGLAPLTDPGTPQARVRQFFEERAFWLWLTGHRLGDLRRMVRHYQVQPQQIYPTGQTIFGEEYGNDIQFPIPFREQNNPEAPNGQCINRDA